MNFTLSFDLDSAAFADLGPVEISRIQRLVAVQVGEKLPSDFSELHPAGLYFVRDCNGNKVGHWTVETREV